MGDKVTIIGDYPNLLRKRTGLFSLDMALGNRGYYGLPMRSIIEIYGHPNAGKSTLSYYLSAKSAETGQIVVCDLEMLDRDYIATVMDASGFHDTVRLVDVVEKKKPVPHERMLTVLADSLYDEEVGAVILDSVGAIQPLAEREGDFGEAFMGKRAKLVAQVVRSLSNALAIKDRPSSAFIINHVHGIMGGKGHTTAGGETLKYHATVRMMLWTDTIWRESSESDSPVLGFQVGGQVEKLRFGGRGDKFKFFIIPGYGIHIGASAMFDCFDLELADQWNTVKIGTKSLGYIRKDLLTYAADGKHRKFDPFLELLEKHEKKMEKEKLKENGKEEK